MKVLVMLFIVGLTFTQVWGNQSDAQLESSNSASDEELEEVTVTAHPFAHLGLTQSSILLIEDELVRAVQESIGATLDSLPGVQNNAFGIVVGRPVVHGLDGPRVKVLSDRLSTMDLGVSYIDHPLLASTIMADSVELINGATSLLFGSGAIGGVVNVVTGRLPDKAPGETSTVAEFSQTIGGTDNNLAIKQDIGLSQHLFLHFDAFIRSGDSYEIPTCPETEEFLELEGIHEDEDEDEHEQDCSVLANSDYSLESGSAGFSIFGNRSSFSTAVAVNQGTYGVPLHFDHHEEEEEEDDEEEGEHHEEEEEEEGEHHEDEEGERVEIDLKQNRVDFNTNVYLQEHTDLKLNLKLGISEYEHAELEEQEIVNYFTNDGYELRAEFVLPKHGNLSQVYGFHRELRDFTLTFDDRFSAERNSFSGYALYRWLGSQQHYEFGMRFGSISDDTSQEISRDFNSYSIAGGILWNLPHRRSFSINSELSTRAPVIEELYIDGVHLATNSIERGDPNLDNERLFAISGQTSYTWNRFGLNLTGYLYWFNDFIYSVDSGLEEDHLPIFKLVQDDVSFRGFDAVLSTPLVNQNEWTVYGEVGLDVVNAEFNDSNDFLPRQPPTRLRVTLNSSYLNWSFGSEFTRVAKAKNLASFELPTPSWHNVKLYASYTKAVGANYQLKFSFQGDNLTNQEQRLHVSPVKDRIVQRGRFFKFSIRFEHR